MYIIIENILEIHNYFNRFITFSFSFLTRAVSLQLATFSHAHYLLVSLFTVRGIILLGEHRKAQLTHKSTQKSENQCSANRGKCPISR